MTYYNAGLVTCGDTIRIVWEDKEGQHEEFEYPVVTGIWTLHRQYTRDILKVYVNNELRINF